MLCAFDQNYAIPAAVTVKSLWDCLDEDVSCDLFLAGVDLDDNTRLRFEAMATDRLTIKWVEVERAWIDDLPLPDDWHFTPTAYSAVFFDRMLPESVRRLIVLDVDIVVLVSLTELWESDLNGAVLGAVRDLVVPSLGAPLALSGWEDLGVDGRLPAFNSGVMVIDRDAWNAGEVETAVVNHLTQFADRIKLIDQEGLNAVLIGRWCELHPAWNYQIHMELQDEPWAFAFFERGVIEEARALPKIVHYAGRTHKPWWTLDPIPHGDAWYRVVDTTAWAGFRPSAAPQRRHRSFARRAIGRLRAATKVLLHGTPR